MRISVRFTAAVHTLLCIDYFEDSFKVTSDFIAGSTGVNAVIIRKILLQLQKANLVTTAAGTGGSHLAKEPEDITLLDIYNAVKDKEDEIFNFHPSPNGKCPVGNNIHRVLDPCLNTAQGALEAELGKTTLADLLKKLPK
ncbi:MAG: Rrf2 family transcriptional regulator [Spirochaetia bacterium]|nr:Rrf2 family transcriptional regulator [Spirochaetia bacterium]MBR5915651.1 Rrf2 family transcriptional regulator [Spirochaetia bacterium]